MDNLALSSDALPFAGVFSFEPDFNNNDDLVSFAPGAQWTSGSRSCASGAARCPSAARSCSGWWRGTTATRRGPAWRCATRCPPGSPVTADAGCAIRGQEVVCRIDALGPDARQAFEVRARAEPAAAGQTLADRATVTALAADPDPTDDASEAAVTIGPSPVAPAGQVPQTDLALRVIAPAGTHRVGDSTRWTIEVTNVSQATAQRGSVGRCGRQRTRDHGTRQPDRLRSAAPGRLRTRHARPGERRTAVVRLTPVRPGNAGERFSGNVTAAQAETRTRTTTTTPRIRIEEALRHGEPAGEGAERQAPAPAPCCRSRSPCAIVARVRTRLQGLPATAARPGAAPRHAGGSTLRDGRVCWRIDRLRAGSPAHPQDHRPLELRARPANGHHHTPRQQRAIPDRPEPTAHHLYRATPALHGLNGRRSVTPGDRRRRAWLDGPRAALPRRLRGSGGGGIRTPGTGHPAQRFSSPSHSTALPPLRAFPVGSAPCRSPLLGRVTTAGSTDDRSRNPDGHP